MPHFFWKMCLDLVSGKRGYVDSNLKELCYAVNLNEIAFLSILDRTFQKRLASAFQI